MILRAHVKLADLTTEDARAVRVAVDAWAATRPHLERPEVLHVTAPAVGQDAITVGDWCKLQTWATVSVLDPTPADLLDLSDVLAPFTLGDRPALTFTRDPAPAEA